jgi:hypothetical protein
VNVTPTNEGRKVLDPFAPPSDTKSFCVYHGQRDRPHCAECDAEQGIDREALAHAQEREALLARLGELGMAPGVPVGGSPAPNEAVPALTVPEQRAELRARLAALPPDE